jgi:hypothetical protein
LYPQTELTGLLPPGENPIAVNNNNNNNNDNNNNNSGRSTLSPP